MTLIEEVNDLITAKRDLIRDQRTIDSQIEYFIRLKELCMQSLEAVNARLLELAAAGDDVTDLEKTNA